MKLVLRAIIALLLLVFVNCEGRTTQNQALSDDIEEFRKTATFEVDVFEPDTYTEHAVDTLLYNGYRVKIKAYSDMNNSVLFTKIKDTINYQTHYRNYKFDILVEKGGKPIYNQSFDKLKINEAFEYSNKTAVSTLPNFEKLAVLKSIQVDDDPLIKNKVVIDLLYTIPETNKYAAYKLFIDEKGESRFVNVE